MSTSLTADLGSEWREWHEKREQDLAVPYGWLSLTSLHWLPSSPSTLSGLPGLFSVQDGKAVLSAVPDDGYTLATEGPGEPVAGTVTAFVADGQSLDWLRLGDVLIELAVRGGRYVIRSRDPKAPALQEFSGVPSFELDENWLVDGTFQPFEAPQYVTVDTARDDLTQQITAVGTVTVELGGERHELLAAPGAGGTLNVTFHDATNGVETARWRLVAVSAPRADGRVVVDFNRAINLPFAFSDYGTCPAPAPGNALPVAVTAGERAPRAQR